MHIRPAVFALDEEAVLEFAREAELVATVEEGTRIGGFGSAVADLLLEKIGSALPPLMRIGLPDEFPKKYGVQDDLFEIYGLMPRQIADSVTDRARRKRPQDLAGAAYRSQGGGP